MHLISDLGIGGAESMLLKLVQHMDANRYASKVVAIIGGGELVADFRTAGVRVQDLGILPGRRDPRVLTRLYRILMEWRPEILQTWLYHADILGTVAWRITSVPHLIWNVRCSRLDPKITNRATAAILRILPHLSRLPDAVIVNSRSGRNVHKELGYHPRRWEEIPNGFDLELFRSDPETRKKTRARLGIPDEAHVIGMIARGDPLKDHKTFLLAARALLAADNNVAFVLAGSGLDEGSSSIKERAAKLGISNSIRFLGQVSSVQELYPAFDIGTLTSTEEGFSNVIGETMACGVPCVVTDAGDNRRLVGDSGLVVPRRNPEMLVAAWKTMLAMSPAERSSRGRAARERIRRCFGIERIVRRYERLYLDVAGQSAGGTSHA